MENNSKKQKLQHDDVKKSILQVRRVNEHPTLTRIKSHYPLRFMPQEDLNHAHNCIIVYALGYGGGMVQGDGTNVGILVDDNACLCLRTQGATKIYKTGLPEIVTNQTVTTTINTNGFMIYTPDHTSLYKNSTYHQEQSYKLKENASLIHIDWFSCGRNDQNDVNKNELWNINKLITRLSIEDSNQKKILCENLDLEANVNSNISVADKLGNATIFGILVLIGPKTAAIRNRLKIFTERQSFHQRREEINAITQHRQESDTFFYKEPLVSVSNLSDDLTVMRFASGSIDDIYKIIIETLSPLQSALNYIPYVDKCHEMEQYPFQCDVSFIQALKAYDDTQANTN